MLSIKLLPLISFQGRSHTERNRRCVELPPLRRLEKKPSDRVHLGQLIVYPTIFSQKLSEEHNSLFLHHLLFPVLNGQRQPIPQTWRWKSRHLCSNPLVHGSEQPTQVLLTLLYLPMEAACPAGNWGDVWFSQCPLHQDPGAPLCQQPKKDSEGAEGKMRTSPLILSLPKMQSWTIISYFLLHPTELFFWCYEQ